MRNLKTTKNINPKQPCAFCNLKINENNLVQHWEKECLMGRRDNRPKTAIYSDLNQDMNGFDETQHMDSRINRNPGQYMDSRINRNTSQHMDSRNYRNPSNHMDSRINRNPSNHMDSRINRNPPINHMDSRINRNPSHHRNSSIYRNPTTIINNDLLREDTYPRTIINNDLLLQDTYPITIINNDLLLQNTFRLMNELIDLESSYCPTKDKKIVYFKPKPKPYKLTIVDLKLKKNQKDDCSICLNGFKLRENQAMLIKCKHCFHQGCLDKWIEIKKQCPLCKSEF